MASSESKTTTDHDEIRTWAEARNAKPVSVAGTGSDDDPGVLRFDLPGYDEDGLEELNWDDFFATFEENNLALLYQEETAGGEQSNFNKFVRR